MAQGDQYDIGELVGTIQFDLPEKEKAKLDTMADQSNELKGAFSAFKKGGSAIFAAFSAVALLFGAGGFRQIIDLLFTTVKLLGALIAGPFVDTIRQLLGETQKETQDIEERGFFTPDRLASLFFGALAAAAAFLAGAPAWLALGTGLAVAFLSSIIDSKLWTGVKKIVTGLGALFVGLITDNLSMVQSAFKEIWLGLKNVGQGIWAMLPQQFRDALRSGASWIRRAANYVWGQLKAGANWIQNHINPIDWAVQFVNWLRSVNWSSVFTFDIPGVNLTGQGGAADTVGTTATNWWDTATQAVVGGG